MNRVLTALFALLFLFVVMPASVSEAAPLTDTNYTVQPGDNLYRIALRYGVTVDAIVTANGLSSTVIFPGQVLRIPAAGTTPQPPATTPPSGGSTGGSTGGVYTVQPGDFLSSIARRFGTTYQAIMAANNLTSTVIFPGQRLTIPGQSTGGTQPPASTTPPATGGSLPGGVYTVQSGDFLSSIARRFGTTYQAIMAANNLTSTVIFPGQRLTIPGQATGGAPAPAPTAAPPTGSVPPPTTIGNFALGGQVAGFGSDAEAALREAKMTWVKRQVVWGPGSNASDHIGVIVDAHNRGFKILLSVKGDPANTRPELFPEYAAFVAALAAGGADAIEVWNEQNITREWAAGQINPATYTSMLQQAYIAIKAANPNTLVISGGPAPTGFFGGQCTPNGCDDLPYIQGMVNAGALNYMDCLGIHYNEGLLPPAATSGDPRGFGSHYTRYYAGMVNTYLTAVSNRRPLCFTELGYLSGEEWGSLPSAFLWRPPYNMTVAQHAQYLAEATQLAIQNPNVRMLIIFNVDIKTYTDDPQAGYAMIRPGGGCPACAAIGNVVP